MRKNWRALLCTVAARRRSRVDGWQMFRAVADAASACKRRGDAAAVEVVVAHVTAWEPARR